MEVQKNLYVHVNVCACVLKAHSIFKWLCCLVTGRTLFMKKALGKTAYLPCFPAAFTHFYLAVWEILFSNEIFIDIRAHDIIVYYNNL